MIVRNMALIFIMKTRENKTMIRRNLINIIVKYKEFRVPFLADTRLIHGDETSNIDKIIPESL